MLLSLVLVLIGIAMLYQGGEMLVDNSIKLARNFGVSSLVIGLTVVAFATSAPELATTLSAAFQGSPDMAIANILGSNIANVGLILGVAALIVPLTVTFRFIRREVAFMVFVTILIYPILATRANVDRFEGLFLVLMLAIFIATQLRETKGKEDADPTPTVEHVPVSRLLLLITAGVALLVLGAQSLVYGASDIARAMGVTDRVIGATLVALGTSLPELAAAVVAARRNEGDLVLGNVIGSNIFNLLCILGITSMVHPIQVAGKILAVDFWVVLGISLLLLAFLAWNRRLVRAEGALLLAAYCGYTYFLFSSTG
ncbi:MAG: calcium/sodium antiporter [Acidobacteriota bacterium]